MNPQLGDPAWTSRAIEALSAFGPRLDQDDVVRLLSLWRGTDQLTADQTTAVLDYFARPVVERHAAGDHSDCRPGRCLAAPPAETP